MEEYLKSVHVPECDTSEHRQKLRQELLEEMERRQKMAFRRRTLKIIYVLL